MLEQLQPKEVFYYFEQICQIPHGSGNTKQISDYLVEFAKKLGLEHYQDEINNVIIIKEATEGYENEPAIIIQGHMDMVTVKEADCTKNMETEGLDLLVDGDFISAKGTSLGADDGIAVAYALAALASETLKHPRLEVVITVDEEVGMDGALAIDLSMLKGKRLLNIDSEKQGELTVSCAGGVRINGRIPCKFDRIDKNEEDEIATVTLCGLTGGHSGTEIHHNRANANILMGEILRTAIKEISLGIIGVSGGLKDNAIPLEAKAMLIVNKKNKVALETILKECESRFKEQYSKTDAKLKIQCEYTQMADDCEVIKEDDARKIADFLAKSLNGVQAMSAELENLVETSLNLGIVKMYQDGVEVAYSLRSSKKDAKEELSRTIVKYIEWVRGNVTLTGDYPAWEYNKGSKLVLQMSELYESMFGEKAVILAIHAGLECGVLADKIPGLDCVSFGPDIFDIHTTNEKLSISSSARMWEYLKAILELKTEG